MDLHKSLIESADVDVLKEYITAIQDDITKYYTRKLALDSGSSVLQDENYKYLLTVLYEAVSAVLNTQEDTDWFNNVVSKLPQ